MKQPSTYKTTAFLTCCAVVGKGHVVCVLIWGTAGLFCFALVALRLLHVSLKHLCGCVMKQHNVNGASVG